MGKHDSNNLDEKINAKRKRSDSSQSSSTSSSSTSSSSDLSYSSESSTSSSSSSSTSRSRPVSFNRKGRRGSWRLTKRVDRSTSPNNRNQLKQRRSRSKSRSKSRSLSNRRPNRSPTPRPTKIHIGKLSKNVTKEHIEEIFEVYGKIKEIDFPKDRINLELGRGFAYIEFTTADEAENAMKHMDGAQIDGGEVTAAPILIPKRKPSPPRQYRPIRQRQPRRRTPLRFRKRPLLTVRPPRRRRISSRRSPSPKRRSRSRSSKSRSRSRSRRSRRSNSSTSRSSGSRSGSRSKNRKSINNSYRSPR